MYWYDNMSHTDNINLLKQINNEDISLTDNELYKLNYLIDKITPDMIEKSSSILLNANNKYSKCSKFISIYNSAMNNTVLNYTQYKFYEYTKKIIFFGSVLFFLYIVIS